MLFLRPHEDLSFPQNMFVLSTPPHRAALYKTWRTHMNIFDEFWGLNSKPYCWVWIWTTLEFSWKAKNFFNKIAFAKHVSPLSSFGAFLGQFALPIERACFLGQASRCVMLWHSNWRVCIFLNLEKGGKKWILCSICLLTILFCVLAFADHVGLLRMAPLLCMYQHNKGAKKW